MAIPFELIRKAYADRRCVATCGACGAEVAGKSPDDVMQKCREHDLLVHGLSREPDIVNVIDHEKRL